MDLILASASPRRIALLKQVGAVFSVVCSNIDEVVDFSLPATDIVQSLAQQKAEAVAQLHKNALILGADTVVVKNGRILGKPVSLTEAKAMLQTLSGTWHQVMTGITIIDAGGRKPAWMDIGITEVKFRTLSEHDIAAYLATGESMDKAGAYRIQGFGALLVEEIKGCYFNVVGLPLQKVANGLQAMGVNLYDYNTDQLQNEGLS